MTDQMVIEIVRDAFWHVLMLVGPLLLVSLIVGLTISIFQAATSISEQTLSFVPKLIAVLVVTILLLPFMLTTMKDYFSELMNIIQNLS